MSAPKHFLYRADVDGLRAVAVLGVVLFHFGLGCPGGFVGVDVFFVISGFLITSLIWKDLQNDQFSFANFWERRFRRIAPALLAMLFATLVAGYFLLLPKDLISLGKSAAMSLACTGNIYFWEVSDYFSPRTDTMPLLHMWSLAVEEQFYLIVPFVMWGMFRFRQLANRGAVLAMIVTGMLLSFLICSNWMVYNSNSAFYLLPSRAWELLIGSLVAMLPAPTGLARSRASKELLSFAGLLMVLAPMLYYTSETSFPGWGAVPPCLGAALLIWANAGEKNTPSLVSRALACRPLVFIGLISYSLYLWHWPLAAYSYYYSIEPLTLLHKVVLLSLSLVLAVLSWQYIETPFRVKKIGATRWSLFRFVGTGMGVGVAASLALVVLQGIPARFPAEISAIAASYQDRNQYPQTSLKDVQAGKLICLGEQNAPEESSILIWGDSHAAAAGPALEEWLHENNMKGYFAHRRGVAPVVGWEDLTSPKKDVLAYNAAVLDYAVKKGFSQVLLIGRWSKYLAPDVDQGGAFTPALLGTIQQLKQSGLQVTLMLCVPEHEFDVPRALALAEMAQVSTAAMIQKTNCQHYAEPDPRWVEMLQLAGAEVINPRREFLDLEGQHYKIRSEGTVLYFDDDHLSVSGAKKILTPFFRQSLSLLTASSQQPPVSTLEVERISSGEQEDFLKLRR